MERNFLGINAKKSVESTDENSSVSSKDGALLGLAVKWPLSKEGSTTQQYVSYKTGEDNGQKVCAFDQFSGSRYQLNSVAHAFETTQKASPVLLPQKYCSSGRQATQYFPVQYPNQSQRTEAFNAVNHQLSEARKFPVVSQHPFPVYSSSNFFKIPRIQSSPDITMASSKQQTFRELIDVDAPLADIIAGTSNYRNTWKPIPRTAQLTIFYDGLVNTYDDVPLDKAQEIMLLARKGSKPPSTAVNPRSEILLHPTSTITSKVAHEDLKLKQPFNPSPLHSPWSVLSSPIPVISPKPAISANAFATADDIAAQKSVLRLSLSNQQETPKATGTNLASTAMETNMHIAIPQAQKASLARFLEKRKERMANVSPIPCIKKSPETGKKSDSTSFSSISSSADNLSSYKSNSDGVKSPSTKLEI